jgi:hypothetical protein
LDGFIFRNHRWTRVRQYSHPPRFLLWRPQNIRFWRLFRKQQWFLWETTQRSNGTSCA